MYTITFDMNELVIPKENRHMKDKVNLKVGIVDKKKKDFLHILKLYILIFEWVFFSPA